jgi:Matrixin
MATLSIGTVSVAESPPAIATDEAATALRAAVAPCPASALYCFSIRVHLAIAGDLPVAGAQWLRASFLFANNMFAPIGAAFQLDALELSAALPQSVDSRARRDGLAQLSRVSPSIDVFVPFELRDLEEPQRSRFGVHWRVTESPARRYVILSAQAPALVLAHELGHYFGLPHSSYPISIMNKTERSEPPVERRRFADAELTRMKNGLAEILKRKELVPVPAR